MKYLAFFMAITLPYFADINEREMVARQGKEFLTTIDSFGDVGTSIAFAAYVQNYAHEYGHKIALDEIGIRAKVSANPMQGKVDYYIPPERERLIHHNHGAGLEIDQMFAEYAMVNLLDNATVSDYYAIARNHAMIIYHLNDGGDGEKYQKSLGHKNKFKLASVTQALNYTALLDLPVSLGNRTHFSEIGVDQYYDVYVKNKHGFSRIHYRQGLQGIGYMQKYKGYTAEIQVTRKALDFSSRLELDFHYMSMSLSVGYKEDGIFIGKPREEGLYYSLSLGGEF